MRSTLRSFVLAPAIVVAIAFTANTVMAESIKVPFNFTVAGKSCPAGVYSVNASGNSVNLMGRSEGNFTWLTHTGNPNSPDGRVVLTFDQVGADHVLRSVQFGSEETFRLDKKLKVDESAQVRIGQGQGQ
jgi:hypothetical protein